MKTRHNHFIKQSATIFLQVIIVLVGFIVLAALLWEPQTEGVNAHAGFFQIYFDDPYLAYVYIASIPFFVALFQAFKGLRYIRQNKIFSQAAIKTLGTIKYCGLIIAGSTVAADIYIRIVAHNNDDPTGALMLGVIVTFVSIVVTAVAAVCEKILQNAVDIKSENDLTV